MLRNINNKQKLYKTNKAMQIYNPTDSQMTLPLGRQYITVPAHGTSTNILGTSEFISLLMSTYTDNEVALIVSGPQELAMVANIPGAVLYVVQSLEEAINKFQKSE